MGKTVKNVRLSHLFGKFIIILKLLMEFGIKIDFQIINFYLIYMSKSD